MLESIKNALFGKKQQIELEQNPDTLRMAALLDHMGRVVLAPEDPTEREAHRAALGILFDAISNRASDVELLLAQQPRLVFRIDSVPIDRPAPAAASVVAIMGILKHYAKLDRNEHRRPQRGNILVKAMEGQHRVSLRTHGSSQGEVLQLSIRGAEDVDYRLKDLGLLPKQLESIEQAIKGEPGFGILAGKRGHGCSTTLYAIAREHDGFIQNMTLFERRSLLELANIKQVQIEQDTNQQSIAAAIDTLMTGSADIILVDPLDNQQAAEALARAVLAGKRCYAVIPQPDAFKALGQWLKWMGDDLSTLQQLRLLCGQRLIRKLCMACREGYAPDPALLAKLNLPADKVRMLFRPPTTQQVDKKGKPLVCGACQGTGYYGLTALFETWLLSDEARAAMTGGISRTTLTQLARRTGKMLFLQEVALRRVAEGVTSVQEMIRVTADER